MPIINIFFKGADSIPIAGFKENRKIMIQAFKDVDNSLKSGYPIAYFPEGVITKDGEMDFFRPGLEKIISSNNVKIVPMYIHGLWGSFFSRFNGSACSSLKLLLREFKRPVHVQVGESFDFTTLEDAKNKVELLSKINK
jgi:1-acyl-sn-glycerol-3-phosphate acyltransferase